VDIIPILIIIVPLPDSTVVDWRSFFCRSDPGNANRHSYRWFTGRDREVPPTCIPQQMTLYLLEMVLELLWQFLV